MLIIRYLEIFIFKNIDKYVLNGEILTLNKGITRFNASDIANMNHLANSLIQESKEEDANEKK